MRRALLLTALLLAGCSSSPPPPVATGPVGDLSQDRLGALLLQPADLPELTQRRVYAAAELTTQGTPQLSLCRPLQDGAPHQLANVLTRSPRVGVADVFEVVSAYADETAARAAFAQAQADARACTRYTVDGAAYTVSELAAVQVPGGQGLHYRVTTPAVVTGDVRTVAQRGRFLVLLTGYGRPTTGQPLLDYQRDVLTRALARLP